MARRLGFGPGGWDLGLEAEIRGWRPRFWPRGWNLSLEAGIRASKLRFGLQGWVLGLEAGGGDVEEEGEEGKEEEGEGI